MGEPVNIILGIKLQDDQQGSEFGYRYTKYWKSKPFEIISLEPYLIGILRIKILMS